MSVKNIRTKLAFSCRKFSAGLLCLMLVSCSKAPIQWREEVKLGNGTVIVVFRQTDLVSGGGEWAQNPNLVTPDIRRIRFSFPIDSDEQVEWRSRPETGGFYPEGPLILDVEDGFPVVIAMGSRTRDCPEYRRYIFRDKAWHTEPLQAQDWGRHSNLLIDSSREYLITLEQKKQMNESGAYSKALKNIDPRVTACR